MKLSFSTNRWTGFKTDEFFDIAAEYRFKGIEIHDVSEIREDSLFEMYHKMTENKLSVPVIDMVSDISAVDVQCACTEFENRQVHNESL